MAAVLGGSLPPTCKSATSLPQLRSVDHSLPSKTATSLPQLRSVDHSLPSKTVKESEQLPGWFASYDQKKEEREAIERLKVEVERQKAAETHLKKVREQRTSSFKWKHRRQVSPHSSFLTTRLIFKVWWWLYQDRW